MMNHVDGKCNNEVYMNVMLRVHHYGATISFYDSQVLDSIPSPFLIAASI